MSASKDRKQQPVLSWVKGLVGAAVVITGVPAVVSLVSFGIIPSKFLWVAIPIYLVLAGLAVWQLLRKPRKLWQSVLFLVIGVLIVLLNMYAYNGATSTKKFVNTIQQPQVSYVEYAVVAKKDSQVTMDSAQTVGLINTDNLYRASGEALADETPARQSGYENMTALTEKLNDGSLDLLSIRKANLDMLQENYKEFYDSVATLATYKVRDERGGVVDADVTKPFVLYISGIDTYGDVNEVSRSDVNMLAVVNPQERKLLLVNTPRDYYVTLHGTSGPPDKLTHAGLYGVDMSRETLSDLYGVEIPYYIRLNFTSLVKMIDVVGDITVNSDYAFKSFQQGPNTLNSKRALEFARERYSFEQGDRQRGRNQQKVIEAVIAKMSEPQNIMRYNAVLGALQGSIQTNMSGKSIATMAQAQLNDMKRWQVESMSVDGTGAMLPTYSFGAMPLYVMIPDETSVEYAKRKINQYLQ